MKRYKPTLAALLIAAAFSSRCNAQFAAPASIAPSLIQYSTLGLGGLYSTSRLFLYNADQTWVEINSSYTSPIGSTTFAAQSGTYSYSVDPSNPSHGTIVYGRGTGPGTNDDLYFFGANWGNQTPSEVSLPPQPAFYWSPYQISNGGVNVSNRCTLSSGALAISGFVVQTTSTGWTGPGSAFSGNGQQLQPTGPRWVLLRAVGATLTTFGVSGVVSNPTFTLYDSTQRAVGTSSVWSSDSNLISGYSTIFSLAGAFPLNSGSDEGVLLVQLTPGAYTAVFKAGSAGTILCEVYILPF